MSLEITGDAAMPRASNWATILRPEEDSEAKEGGGASRTWRRRGLHQEGCDLQLSVQDYPQKPPESEPLQASPLVEATGNKRACLCGPDGSRTEKVGEGVN